MTTLAVAIAALIGSWAVPAAADETDGIDAVITAICTDVPEPASVQVWFDVHNTTPVLASPCSTPTTSNACERSQEA